MAGVAVLVAGGLLLSSIPQAAATQDATVGGYDSVPLTVTATELLVSALGNEANYAADVTDRVCVHNVTAVSEQIVAGINYRFEITGSAVENAEAAGWCTNDDDGSAESYQVTVFEQSWLNTVAVTSIELAGHVDGSASSSGSGSGSWGYGDAGYSSYSFDSSASYSSSGSGINAGDVGYVGDEAEASSSYDSSSASGNEAISFVVGY